MTPTNETNAPDPLFLALDRNAPEDTADYGPMGNPDYERGPDETYCRNCDQIALDHTPGRWSIYGVCPTNTTNTKETN